MCDNSLVTRTHAPHTSLTRCIRETSFRVYVGWHIRSKSSPSPRKRAENLFSPGVGLFLATVSVPASQHDNDPDAHLTMAAARKRAVAGSFFQACNGNSNTLPSR